VGILTGCKPRKEVLKGDLDDAIFAADFGDLIAGKAPAVYGDAATFFQNTHPAKQLCKVVQDIFSRLAEKKEGGVTARLSTGFGGGKTHTLMALWHLARHIDDPGLGTDLLPAAGRPESLTVAAIDASKAGYPVFARHAKIETRSLWGELAFQFGGEKGWKAMCEVDDAERQPDETLVQKLFPRGSVLILLDELVVYMATLSERGQGNLLAFLGKLSAVVSKRPRTVLVVTDPAEQRAYAAQSSKLGGALANAAAKATAAAKLDDLLGRKASDFDPIGGETARVIVRRLFERGDPSAAQAASANYHALFERVARDAPGTIPPRAASVDYARQVVECYPFHPRLLETARDRLGALQEFNKSRGTLRLFARILRTVWEAKEDIEIISAGDVDWSSSRIQADLLQRLNRDNFKAAVSADVENHAAELDGSQRRGVHVRAASALLLESIPLQPNSGLDPADLTLAILRPDEAGHEPGEALDRLVGVCWHTYPMPGGRGWQFRYEPNLIKQIEEGMGQIPLEDAHSRVLTEAQSYFHGPSFKVSAWPTSARQVPESAELQLALCEDEKIAKAVCAYCDDSNPAAPIPRRFVNAIVAVTATQAALGGAVERAQRMLAAEAIEKEHRTGDSGKLVREQLQRIMPDLRKQFRVQTCRAFDRVVLACGASYPLDEQYQVPEEQMLQHAHGQSCLRRFLEAKQLIYTGGDALDTKRFLDDVLRGATPLSGDPDVYTALAVHGRFLSAPRLRMIPDGGIVRQSVLKALEEGKLVVKLPDGRAYDRSGCVEGEAGRRRRVDGHTLTSLSLDESVRITLADSAVAAEWLRIDARTGEGKAGEKKPPLPPVPQGPSIAETWEKTTELAAGRPLVELILLAATPASAKTLAVLAQELSADALRFTVTVGGPAKDGGAINFSANELRLNHPVKPLDIAQTIYNALDEMRSFEAELTLGFTAEGRAGMREALKRLSEQAAEDIRPRAKFARPLEGS